MHHLPLLQIYQGMFESKILSGICVVRMFQECFKEMATINKQICRNSNLPHSPLNQTIVGLHH